MGDNGEAVAYEIVFDCRDAMVGGRLIQSLENVVGPTWDVERSEAGPTWALIIRFSDQEAAERFFDSDFYEKFCGDVRQSCSSSVLVVPLGNADESST